MKKMINMTTSPDDMERFPGRENFLSFIKNYDGVELMWFGDADDIVRPENVIGLHMGYFAYWLDYWNGDDEAVAREFDTLENAERYYGGSGREAIINRFRADLANAHRYGAEYVVFHVSDATIEESFTFQFRHSSYEVVDAAADLLNEVFAEEDGRIALLVENLWLPGLTMTEPEITRRLMDGIHYPNKGIMLDTGHVLHTDFTLRTQEEGLSYINRMLDEHGGLCRYIRGMHLNQSLTGEYCERTKNNPPKMGKTFEERVIQMFTHAFAVDGHRPFTCKGVDELIRRVNPEYLTLEFITGDNEQHSEYLRLQEEYLKGL